MIQLRPSEARGRGKLDWLDSYFSFSFAQYYDPAHMNFSELRVINEDYIAPNQGFATHGHRKFGFEISPFRATLYEWVDTFNKDSLECEHGKSI